MVVLPSEFSEDEREWLNAAWFETERPKKLRRMRLWVKHTLARAGDDMPPEKTVAGLRAMLRLEMAERAARKRR